MHSSLKFSPALFAGLVVFALLQAAPAFAQVQMNNLATTDISITSARVSWTTDQETADNRVEVRVKGTDSLTVQRDDYLETADVHYVQLRNLKVDTEYEYRVLSGAGAWDNAGKWYAFRTFPNAGSFPPLPVTVTGRLVDKSGQPVKRALVRISVSRPGETSVPTTVLTTRDGQSEAENGLWICNLANFLNQQGTHFYPQPGDGLEIQYLPNYWTSDTSSALVGDKSPQSVGEKTIDVYDPGQGVRGDLNGDLKIDIFDLLDTLKVMGGKLQPSSDPRLAYAADVDGNGKYDIFDLLALLRLLSGGKA